MSRPFRSIWAAWLSAFLACVLAPLLRASDQDEFKVKREEVFEFAEPPKVTRGGDRVEIAFTSKGYCDATVAVENAAGKIVRHLASGVLGPKAPAPFQKNALAQAVVWDGKDDQGRYIDDQGTHTVRVSLGLKPLFEKNLFWEPKKRLSQEPLLIQAAPEGVYVYDGKGVDHLRLFDHAGNYLRTVYPFPAGKLSQVQGLQWHEFPQDGQKLPLKLGFFQSTLLTSGYTSHLTSASAQHPEKRLRDGGHCYSVMCNNAATAMAVRDGRIALAQFYLNRLATDGSSGGLPLDGPKTSFAFKPQGDSLHYGVRWGGVSTEVLPRSAALSPKGQWLYLTGYVFGHVHKESQDIWNVSQWDGLHGVVRLALDGNTAPEVFAGSMTPDGSGTDAAHFKVPASVACDDQGRVYVADHMNDRVQVFLPDGKHLQSIPVDRPAQVVVHRRTREIYVLSWVVYNKFIGGEKNPLPRHVLLTHFGPLENPKKIAAYTLPLGGQGDHRGSGMSCAAELDSWTDPPTLWIVGERLIVDAHSRELKLTEAVPNNIRLLTPKNGKWNVTRDFAEEVKRSVVRSTPPFFSRQRLYVNPKNGKLYAAEGQTAWYKALYELVEIDPETGKIGLFPLPFDAEDLAFDLDGLIYLKEKTIFGRYDPATWREVPFDYGEERESVGYSSSRDGRTSALISGIPFYSGTLWHKGGICVSPKGHMAVSCYVSKGETAPQVYARTNEANAAVNDKPYVPQLYPGRWRFGEIHVWDKHGKMVYEDAVQGLNSFDGLGIDKDDSIYLMATPTRVLDGRRYFNEMTGTVMKFKPKHGKLTVATAMRNNMVPIPLPAESRPKRPAELEIHGGRPMWVEGAEWMYGGVGFMGRNANVGGSCCGCWNTRFTLDYFGRSFVPEVDHFSVAVLDTNGNLILRVGKYGNVDSAGPRSLVPLDGDGVGFFFPAFIATHTDRRLFVADPGNARIVSVKLDYHAEEKVALKSVPDAAKRK